MRIDMSASLRVCTVLKAVALVALGLVLPAVAPSSAMASSSPDAAACIELTTRAADPIAAAGADLSASSFGELRAAVEASNEFAACTGADEASRYSRVDYAMLRERIWRRGGSSQDLASLADLRQDVAAAQTACDQDLTDLREFAHDELVATAGESDADLAMRMQANLSRHTPVAALCLDLTEQQWQALEAALAKRASGATLTQDEQAVAAIHDSSPEVALVATRLAASKTEYDAYMAGLAAEIRAAE